MKKRILAAVFVLAMIITSLPIASIPFTAAAADYTYKGFTYTVDGNTAIITDYDVGYGTTVTVPEKIDKYTVVEIGDAAFASYSTIEKVTLPSTIKKIGMGAFLGCYEMAEINIPDNVESIGDIAFGVCTSLVSINIPSKVEEIGSLAFAYCESLTAFNVSASNPYFTTLYNGALATKDKTVLISCPGGLKGTYTIPYGIQFISEGAFAGCAYLEVIRMATDVEWIGAGAFSSCEKLTEIEIADSVLVIDNFAFEDCPLLTKITIPKNVDYLGFGLFYDCSSYLNVTISPKNEKYVCEDGVIYTTEKYDRMAICAVNVPDEFKIPDGVTFIALGAFYGCKNLSAVAVPESVTTICAQAFDACTKISKVYIPASVTAMDEGIFDESRANITIYTDKNSTAYYYAENDSRLNAVTTVKNGFEYSVKDGNATITKVHTLFTGNDIIIPETINGYPVTSVAQAFPNTVTSVVLPESLKSLGAYAFYNCSKLSSIVLPSGLEAMGSNVFYGCEKLRSITIPGSVSEIPDLAFSRCSALKEVTIEYGVERIGNSAFSSCTSLESIAFPDSVTEMGNSVFSSCSKLKNAPFIAGMTVIPTGTFDFCSSLENIVIPDSVEAIGDNAFRNCNSLKNIVISENVKSIGVNAFNSCGALESIVLPNSVKELGDGAFSFCSNLKNVTLPEGLTSIPSDAFEYCSSLESIVIPDSVKNIDRRAFSHCTNLKSINIPQGVTTIGADAFNSTGIRNIELPDGLKTVTPWMFTYSSIEAVAIPDKVTTIGNSAFEECSELKTVSFSRRLLTIGGSAFEKCTSLTEIELPNTVKSIGSRAFAYCTSLEKIIIPNSVTSINSTAFNGIKSSVTIYAEEGSYAYDYAVQNNIKVVSVDLPDAPEEDCSIKSVSYSIEGQSIVFNVVTGLYADTIKVVYKDKLYYTLATSSSKVVNDNGDLEYTVSVNIYNLNQFTEYVIETKKLDATEYSGESACINVEYPYEMQKILGVTHEIADDKIIFEVTTSYGSMERIKATLSDNLSGSIAITTSSKNNYDGTLTWTITADAPVKPTEYAFDIRTSEGKYQKDYFRYKVEIEGYDEDELSDALIKKVSHEIKDGKIYFTVTTAHGDYERVKSTLADNLSGSIAVSNTYTVNSYGNYVWTIKAVAPDKSTSYAFDVRTTEKKYLKDYFVYDVEIPQKESVIKNVSYRISGEKVIFTVTTDAGEFNRIKVTAADDLTGYIAYTNSYTVNANGDYVWTLTAPVPSENAKFAFDLRSDITKKYVREYFYCDVDTDITTIKSVDCSDGGDKLIFTVVTAAGDYNRLRCGLSKGTTDNLANANSYTVNSNGDFVWVIKINKPQENTTLYFDLRDSSQNKFIKDYFIYSYAA